MSLATIVLVLASLVAQTNAQFSSGCSVSTYASSTTVISSPTPTSAGLWTGSATFNCIPGYTIGDSSGSTSFSVSCATATGSSIYTATPSGSYYTCSTRNYQFCPSTINNNFGNTTTVTAYFSRAVGDTVWLICKPTGLGRNWRGNGTAIKVTCSASADGSTGIWTSEDWCSGALGVSANVAVLALAALAGLLYKRFF